MQLLQGWAEVVAVLATLLVLSHSLRVQRQESCPPALCADPVYQVNGCGSCEGSQCMLRGCVHHGAFFTSWKPDDCTECFCEDGQEICTAIDCAPLNCYDYPTLHRPGRCCPECDFNISASECGVIPVATTSVNVTVALGDGSCQQSVVLYRCDKNFIVEDDGTWYMCDPMQGEVTRQVRDLPTPGCGPAVSQVTYETVTSCERRELSDYEILQDYEFYPFDCYYIVFNQTNELSLNQTIRSSSIANIAPPILLTSMIILIQLHFS